MPSLRVIPGIRTNAIFRCLTCHLDCNHLHMFYLASRLWTSLLVLPGTRTVVIFTCLTWQPDILPDTQTSDVLSILTWITVFRHLTLNLEFSHLEDSNSAPLRWKVHPYPMRHLITSF
ncbi:hypothetical protein XELAEV_18038384mg [Xenopus laevis]|uniref:Uncharacterized protein n=1 Tax=Xenopus laevis TaxID=8355 RepID=A0A974C5Q1_XENLA|nr:hypothetical protein XELAEV_18038384mg [Xenopus laevis]